MEITSSQREVLAKCLMDSTSGMGGAENALKGFTNLGTIAEVDVLDNKCLPINHYAIVEDFHKRALRVSSGVDTYLIEFDYSSVRLIGEMRAKRSEASIPCGLTTEKIISLIGLDKLYVSHYNYADLFLDQFWQEATAT